MAGVQAGRIYQTKSATVADTALPISDAGWGWTAGNLALADAAYVSVIAQPVSMTWDGTTPTTALGRPLVANETVEVYGNANVQAIQLIRQGGVSATVSIALVKF